MDYNEPPLTSTSTQTPQYESRFDSAKARIPEPHAHTLRQRYHPSWKPKNTLTNGSGMDSSYPIPDSWDSQGKSPLPKVGKYSSTNYSDDKPRIVKKRRIERVNNSTPSVSQGAALLGDQSQHRYPAQISRLGKTESHRSSGKLSSFANSEFYNLENMMRPRPAKSKSDHRVFEMENEHIRGAKPSRQHGDTGDGTAGNNTSQPRSIHDLVNLSSHKPSEKLHNPESPGKEGNGPSTVPGTKCEKEILGRYDDSESAAFTTNIGFSQPKVHSASKDEKTSARNSGHRRENAKKDVSEPKVNLRHTFIREAVSLEDDRSLLAVDPLHADLSPRRVKQGTSAPEKEQIHPPRKKLVQMLRAEDDTVDEFNKHGSYQTKNLRQDDSNPSERIRTYNRKAHPAPKDQSGRLLSPDASSWGSSLENMPVHQDEETQLLQKRNARRARRSDHSATKLEISFQRRSSWGQRQAEQAQRKKSVDLDMSHDILDKARPRTNPTQARSPVPCETLDEKHRAANPHSSSAAPSEPLHSLKSWSRPLLFPPNDPGKAVVEFDDLRRLDGGEFLNDSLLTFGLKYYEHEYRKEASQPKNIYIFNTFFYEKLCATKTVKADINYEGVKRWTSKVDIFAYDFVIVPINESAHWYGALICNLARLDKSPEIEIVEDKAGATNCQHAETMSVDGQQQHPAPKLSLIELSDNTMQQNASEQLLDASVVGDILSLSNESAANQVKQEQNERVTVNGSRRERARQRASGRRESPRRRSRRRAVDPHQPVIILLDSFGENHPAAARKLNQYLREESRSKHDFELESLPCVNAKGIPLQPNAFDCGVYFLGYMQKFFESPEDFVAKAVAKSFHTDQDFADLDAPRMRQTIRSILHHEYKIQSEARKGQNKKWC